MNNKTSGIESIHAIFDVQHDVGNFCLNRAMRVQSCEDRPSLTAVGLLYEGPLFMNDDNAAEYLRSLVGDLEEKFLFNKPLVFGEHTIMYRRKIITDDPNVIITITIRRGARRCLVMLDTKFAWQTNYVEPVRRTSDT